MQYHKNDNTYRMGIDIGSTTVKNAILDENNEIIGYEYLSLGKFTDFLKKGIKAEEALEKAKGTYGRFADGSKYIDPREE